MATTAIAALPVPGQGPPLLRVISPQSLTEQERAATKERENFNKDKSEDASMTELASFLRKEWQIMRDHRASFSGWNERLLHAQRVFNGQYDATKLAEIKQFGGSDVYARVIALKCRGASALLREVYLGTEKSWGLDPTPDPVLPEEIADTVATLVSTEAQQMGAEGRQPDINHIRDRTNMLMGAAKRAAKEKAKEQSLAAEQKLDDLLTEGGFYDALAEFLVDLPLFPFACIKGPIVRVVPDVVWQGGKATTVSKPRMFWERKSPFDLYWTPGVSSIRDAAVIERLRLTRADLNDLLGLPGYREEAIRQVLDDYGRGGLTDWMDSIDQQRSEGESRESPHFNRSGMIDCIEYHGNVQGRMLKEFGFTSEVTDELRDYFVQAWLIGRHIIKVQFSPNPRKRHPYYITSFEKVPGTPVGNALPDILADVQDVCNATLRSLVNNMSIASGPQVVVDEERLSPLENADEMYPWKRWRTRTDAFSGVQNNGANPPIAFFSPASHANELLGVYKEFVNIADELSAIPKYITGSDRLGGAGRTSSGLAMLMGNASKVLQMVAGNVDRDVMQEMLQYLYDMVMLTDQTGTFRGDEAIRVRGVEVAVQRETARMRQIEFLQGTQNPIDFQIMGPEGRAKLLREVSKTVGIEGDVVPSDEDLKAKMAPPPGMLPPGTAPPGDPAQAMLTPPGNNPSPANGELGVPEANAMRGMV